MRRSRAIALPAQAGGAKAVSVGDGDLDGDLDVVTTEEVSNLGVIWYENRARRAR